MTHVGSSGNFTERESPRPAAFRGGRLLLPVLLLGVLGNASQTVAATGLIVGGAATVQLGNNVLSLGCNDVVIESGGTLEAQTSKIYLAGNWDNQGSFDPGTGTVYLTDGCGPGAVAQVNGESTFYRLDISTSGDKVVQFEAGATQTILRSLGLTGLVPGSPLTILSSSPGVQAIFDLAPGAARTARRVAVMDNAAVGETIRAVDDSEDLGNNTNWTFEVSLPPSPGGPGSPGGLSDPASAPALSPLGLALLMLVLLVVARWRIRGRESWPS